MERRAPRRFGQGGVLRPRPLQPVGVDRGGLRYLDETDPDAPRRARERYACFDHASVDAQSYGYAAAIGAVEPCEDEVVEQLLDMRRQSAELAARDGRLADDRQYAAEQNARHNSHLGDARATEMGARGELSLGQLVTERHGPETVRVGFSTHSGTVTAASDWDAPAERKVVRPALPGSWEDLLHGLEETDVLVVTDEAGPALRGRSGWGARSA